MNEWMDTIAQFATDKADALEALADHVRSLGKTEKADGLMLAVNGLRADARVFSAMARPDATRLRLVK